MTYAAYYGQTMPKDIDREAVSAFSSLSQFPSGTAQERMPGKEFTGHNLSAPLWTIPVKKKHYRSTKPIKVYFHVDDNVFFAENETLVVVGTGKSLTEAMADLSEHIIHFYNYYKKLPFDKVTGDAIRLKKVYETLFIEE
ncbi:MAG: hypothetical protein Q8P28_05645 [Deltaproteobacteria bacterium]|nr:hypothetical protein [Deltaproteobacteria bacterium]